MLRIHFGEDDKWKEKPLYRAIVEKCRELDIAGATVFRGIEGYGASTLIRRAHLLSFSSDAPVMVTVIDSEEKILQLLPHLDQMVQEGLIAMSEVEVIKYVHQMWVGGGGGLFARTCTRAVSVRKLPSINLVTRQVEAMAVSSRGQDVRFST